MTETDETAITDPGSPEPGKPRQLADAPHVWGRQQRPLRPGRFFRMLLSPGRGRTPGDRVDPIRYRTIWLFTMLVTSVVTITPLVILTAINTNQFTRSLEELTHHDLEQQLAKTARSIEFFLEERTAALEFIVHRETLDRLCDQSDLTAILQDLKLSFGHFVDLGIIDQDGLVMVHAGPTPLSGRDYQSQGWFKTVLARDRLVSDVFLGYRRYPHLVIAVTGQSDQGKAYVLRATIDANILSDLIAPLEEQPWTDAFLVNAKSVLQTPSQLHDRQILEPCPTHLPATDSGPRFWQETDAAGEQLYYGSRAIAHSPFTLVLVKGAPKGSRATFSDRRTIIAITTVSIVVILLLLAGTATYLVHRLREADLERASLLHGMEYTNKMASLGRMAAGVAHEINNPLAIINEKAGLLRDIVTIEMQERDDHSAEEKRLRAKALKVADSIIDSVKRCRDITHRMLGFAKRVAVELGSVQVGSLLDEVVSFLENEAQYRDIRIERSYDPDTPSIWSDRGQLQQVFLNLLNNALQAVEDGGRVEIRIRSTGDGTVQVDVEDNGCGIPEEDRKRVFEPFFTTKTGYGTGLGLSITYGIVSKLGGTIGVASEVGQGTCLTVKLPQTAPGPPVVAQIEGG